MEFQDRDQELRELDDCWRSNRAVFLILSGRRRVGKSRLLEYFFEGKPAIYITGTSQRETNQLADASREIYRVTGDAVLEHQDFSSWDALLAFVAEHARRRRIALIIDEFAYYCDEARELPSLLQRWWDRVASRTKLMLVLASSHIAFMDQLISGSQPLYGRRTADLRVQPLDYFDAGSFLPTYNPVDRLRAYGVFGGMPAYLAACDPALDLEANVRQVVLRPTSYLRTEPTYLLAQERSVEQPRAYFSLLRAIAQGKTQPNEIAQTAGYDAPSEISRFLERLRDMRLVDRLGPIDSRPKDRLSRYVVSDPFLAFWFRFIQGAESLLVRGQDELVLHQIIGPQLDHFLSRAQGPWERACGDYLWRAFVHGLLGNVRFDRLGPWWSGRGSKTQAELDIVARDGARTSVVGSCKWRNEYMKPADLDDVKATAREVNADEDTLYVLFSRSGFDRRLVERAKSDNVRLVAPADMFAHALAGTRTGATRPRRARKSSAGVQPL